MLLSNGAFTLDDPIDNQEIPIMKVPTFYSIMPGSSFTDLQMTCTSFFVATLFGAIHCAGWSHRIHFSTHAGSLLWRISSAVITSCPFAWSMWVISGYSRGESDESSFSLKISQIMTGIFALLTFLTIPLYIVARIILLVLAFVELGNIPPGAFANIRWVNVLPFIH